MGASRREGIKADQKSPGERSGGEMKGKKKISGYVGLCGAGGIGSSREGGLGQYDYQEKGEKERGLRKPSSEKLNQIRGEETPKVK